MARARMDGDVLLLGTGAVGGVIARHLVAHQAVSRLTLADRDTARAEGLARALAGDASSSAPASRVGVAAIDASDRATLRAALEGRALVINAVLPRFNGQVMDAALAAGCAYLDLAGGEEDQLLRHDAWARAGCAAIHAMGEDPGISNVLARRGADLLDQVEAIRVRDGEFSESDDLPLACLFSTETFLEEAVSPSRVFENGAYRDLPPWSGREIYTFPPPVGAQPIYYMAHEEVDTLPRLIGKGVRQVDFKLAIPDEMQRQIAFLDRIGMTRRDAVRVDGAAVRPLALLAAVLPQPADLGGRVRGAAIVLVEVEGKKGGRRVRHVFHAVMTHDEAFRRQKATATAWLTGTGGAAGALALLGGRVPGPGVWSPEQLDPVPVLALLAELGLKVEERTETLPG
jgi:saccharopine dehydrogenase-like NADP-dependent oxidoreductase